MELTDEELKSTRLHNGVDNINDYIPKKDYDKLKAKYNKAVLWIAIEEHKDWEEIDKMLGE